MKFKTVYKNKKPKKESLNLNPSLNKILPKKRDLLKDEQALILKIIISTFTLYNRKVNKSEALWFQKSLSQTLLNI